MFHNQGKEKKLLEENKRDPARADVGAGGSPSVARCRSIRRVSLLCVDEEEEEAERAGSGCSMRPNMSSVGSKSSKEVAEAVPGFEKKLLSLLVLLLKGRTSEFKGCISEFERLMKRGEVTFRTPDSLIALANLDEVVDEEACWLSRLD